jgi:hypothetical protein
MFSAVRSGKISGNMFNRFTKVILVILALFLTLISLLLSPYRLELDLETPQVNEDSLEILKFIYAAILFLTFLYFVTAKSFKSIPGVFMIVMSLYAFVKFLSMFFL